MRRRDRIPYERYFEVAMVPEAGMSLHSYEYLQRLTGDIFATHQVWDAHAHLGKDIDGHELSSEELLAELDRYHVHGAVIFPFDDPDQGEDFRAPNDRVFTAHEQAPDRLVPFMRLNPNGPWEGEYERSAARGCRGVKLHPRAQQFELGSRLARPLFARAAADRLPVLIHTGFGMNAITDELAGLAAEFDGLELILGHSSFIDMPDALRVLAPYSNVYFETSVVRVYDLFTLLSSVDPGRVLYGSDLPYASSYSALQVLVTIAHFAGLGHERLPDLLGGNLLRLLRGRPTSGGEA
ncbi:MAG: amidohydrolase family protein [Micromonosporaceae bacterium]|nr:amidohydrolase family protein [Micromonosporaceae bacterium]